MSDDNETIRQGAPTRRDYVKYGGTVVGGGLLAGCTGGETETTQESDNTTEEESDASESWTASMPPVGDLEFDSVPESLFDSEGFVADVVTALGHSDTVDAFSYEKWPTHFYEQLPGVDPETDFDTSLMTDGKADKEVFYEIAPDIITIDPNLMMSWELDAADISEIEENVGPIFGQRARGPRADGFYKYGDGEPYPYLDLYEQTEIYGQVFQEQDRAEAIIEVNRELIDEVTSRLPPESERPTVMVGGIFSGEVYANVIYFEETTPEVVRDGEVRTYSKKQYRELGVVNAFADAEFDGPFWTTTDGEGLLEADPEMIFLDNGVADEEFVTEQTQTLREDSVMSEVTAVKEDQIYPGGTAVQGPIVNMFQTEMVAKQLYSEEFGEWHGLGETPEDEQLFDRQRVADIINGDI
ncbi:ABC transporter substrate-binding protein [Halorubrum sp. AD140]|uniref:ABC transporter substrate-binding protein n=1 Tax=Halorubrum sp. AD140 TaxID=3050073 RepID=UPI002ACCCD5F|nr:ABC transporter substrate-binding protein [Halorubrum sp. AD140]MDZ5812754.1 ABC transporter substrate-binding protein [Halorubrum sp. AD140]